MVLLSLAAPAARSSDAEALPGRPRFQATLLLLQERVPRPSAFYLETPGASTRARPASGLADADARAHHPGHADPGGAAAVERPLPRHGHERGRRLQPLEGSRRHALARGRHLRPLGQLLLPARRRRAASSGRAAHQPTLKRAQGYEAIFSEARAEFRPPRPRLRDAHRDRGLAREDDIELRRLRITNRAATRGRSRSRAMPRWCSRRRRPTPCTRPSATSSCRPRSCASARRSSARAGRARHANARPGCST